MHAVIPTRSAPRCLVCTNHSLTGTPVPRSFAMFYKVGVYIGVRVHVCFSRLLPPRVYKAGTGEPCCPAFTRSAKSPGLCFNQLAVRTRLLQSVPPCQKRKFGRRSPPFV